MWPVSGAPIGWPVAASHSRTVLSQLPETMRLPSGLNATLVTGAGVAGQRRADRLAGGGVPQPHRLVSLPETMRLPSGLNATLNTAAGVAGQRRADRLAGVGVPQPHRLVAAAGDDAPAVGAERHTVHGRRRFDDLNEIGHPGQRIEQWTVIRRLRKSSRRNQLLVRAHIAAGAGTGQHGLRLGHQPPSFCLVTLLHGLLSLLNRFSLLHDRDRCGGDRNNGQ